MAIVTGGLSYGIGLSLFSILDYLYDITIATSVTPTDANTYTLFNASGYKVQTHQFTGGGFGNFANGLSTTGTVTGYSQSYSSALVATVSGLSISAAALSAVVTARDSSGFVDLMFGGSDSMTGTSFNDGLGGFNGDDTLIGGDGDDYLDGGPGADHMDGGAGNDIYLVDNLSDTILDSSGRDKVYSILSSFTLSADLEDLEYHFNGAQNFTGIGNARDNDIRGGVGNDVLVGNGGVDVLFGGRGADALIGSADGGSLFGADGNDVLWFYSVSTIDGGTGFDYAIQFDSTAQNRSIATVDIEVYVANIGFDVIDAIGATARTIIYGGDGNDSLTQGALGGYLFGQEGVDTLVGGAGQDFLLGGAGADNLLGQDGADVLYIEATDGLQFDGGAGVDYAIVDTAAAVNVDLTTRNVEVFIGNLGNDVINASGVSAPMGLYGFGGDDVLTGSNGASQLFGQDGADILSAGSSNDVVLGGNGNDQVFGNAGADLLLGEAGDDLVVGGAGADTMWGGAGNDTFQISVLDIAVGVRETIGDFRDIAGNDDVINFVGITPSQISIGPGPLGEAIIFVSNGAYTLTVVGATVTSIVDDLLFT